MSETMTDSRTFGSFLLTIFPNHVQFDGDVVVARL